MSEMTFKLQGTGGNALGCKWVYAEGEITEPIATFDAFIGEHDFIPMIVFNSPGGNLEAGITLGVE